jgi:hypothetical protein
MLAELITWLIDGFAVSGQVLQKAWFGWREAAALAATQRSALRTAEAFLRSHAVAKAWQAWRAAVGRAAWQRAALGHALNRLVHRSLAAAWEGWAVHVAARRLKHLVSNKELLAVPLHLAH